MSSLAERWMNKKVAKSRRNLKNRSSNPSDLKSEIIKPDPEIEIEKIPVAIIPQWQQDFCLAHGMFNNWRGSCPCSIDDCLISEAINSGGNIDNLRGLEVGQGITTDMVIDEWLNSGEPAADLFKNPAWLICMAEGA